MPTQFIKGSKFPRIRLNAHTTLPLSQDTWAVKPKGCTVSAQIHPAKQPCIWSIEYSQDPALPPAQTQTTSSRQLPGTLTAVFKESFINNRNNFTGGIGQKISKGYWVNSEGGFFRYSATLDADNDYNHVDGVGVVHLGCINHAGTVRSAPFNDITQTWEPAERGLFGGLKWDLRGAKLNFKVRGTGVNLNGAHIAPWIQFHKDYRYQLNGSKWKLETPNWYFSSGEYDAAIASGEWQDVSLTLTSNPSLWTFAGRDQSNLNQLEYVYGELDSGLAAVSCDMIQMIKGININSLPVGTIDFDDFAITYRNNNLLSPSNGATVLNSPAGNNPNILSDGCRNGIDHEWIAADNNYPKTFEYSFENPITIDCAIVSNATSNPVKTVRIEVKENPAGPWIPINPEGAWPEVIIPDSHPYGSNYIYNYWSKTSLHPNAPENDINKYPYFGTVHSNPIIGMRVIILDAYNPAIPCQLGSVEIYGNGAQYGTDNSWYDVSRDLELPSGTWYYRVSATTGSNTVKTPIQSIIVP